MLDCSLRTLDHLIATEQIEFIKFKRSVRFSPESVESHIARHTIKVFQQPVKKTPMPSDMRMGRF